VNPFWDNPVLGSILCHVLIHGAGRPQLTRWVELLTIMIESEIGEGRAPFTPASVAATLLAAFNGLQVSATLCESGQRGIVETAIQFWRLVRLHCDESNRGGL